MEDQVKLGWHWRDTQRGRFRVHDDDWLSNRDLHDRGYNSLLHKYLARRRWRQVIDAGANTGQSLLMFAPYCDHVISVEPVPELFTQLELTATENCIDHCDLVNRALWHKPDQLRMHYTPTNTLASRVDDTGNIEVEAITIDQLQLQPDLIKVDCEGSDLKVLLGAENTVRRTRPWLLLEMKQEIQPTKHIEQWLHLHQYEPDPAFAPGRGRNVIFQPQVV